MNKTVNESIFYDWKNNKKLQFVDKKVGDAQIIYEGKRYNYFDVCDQLGVVPADMKFASDEDIIRAITEMEELNEIGALNETKYDFRHIDPVTGMPRVVDRPEDKIELMSRMPARSCWVTILQNRVNLNSVGNKRYSKTLWFDVTDKTLSTDRNKEDVVHWRSYILPGAGKPQGWVYSKEHN